MFEDIQPNKAGGSQPPKQQATPAPQQDAKKPVDIFEGVNTGGSQGPSMKTPKLDSMPPKKGSPWKMIGIVAGVIIVVAVVGAGAYYFLWATPPTEQTPVNMDRAQMEEMQEAEMMPEEEMMEEEQPAQEEEEVVVPPPAFPTDTDNDGLSDDEELTLGTNPEVVDTDGDGLWDSDEVEVYGTDPTNEDTDGDGFNDGTEIENGYNPNGPGTLEDGQFES